MDIDHVLLGLIKLNKGITGYELNSNIRDSNRYFLSISLAYIYPTLKKLHERGLVTFTEIPLINRPSKKAYEITPAGEKALEAWLKKPIDADMYFSSFLLKMQFAPLMEQATLLGHIDREISRLEDKINDLGQLPNCLYSGKVEQEMGEVLMSISQVLINTDEQRLAWLKDWRRRAG
ncbi:MAG: PadR family transcriptional regulator [Anaerolineae bacterium]|nr:PadR family transcriptional regulator [Anaerolineae bacterium]